MGNCTGNKQIFTQCNNYAELKEEAQKLDKNINNERDGIINKEEKNRTEQENNLIKLYALHANFSPDLTNKVWKPEIKDLLEKYYFHFEKKDVSIQILTEVGTDHDNLIKFINDLKIQS